MALKHAKFDSFLKRTLDDKVYESVKVCDPCIVLSKSEKRTFRFVFLTDEALCITDNPPKSILYTISLRYLRDVQLVHDTASFLQKDLQKIVQHVMIKCRSHTKHENIYEDPAGSLNRTSSSSVIKSVFSSLLNKPKNSENNVSVGSASPAESIAYQYGSHKRNGSYNENNNNMSRDIEKSLNVSLNDSFLPTSNFSCLDFDDSLSVAGSSSNLSDHQTASPRTQSSWVKCDPFQTDVLDSDTYVDTEEIHLYILNDSSVFFMMLKFVWRSYLISSTLSLEQNTVSNFSMSQNLTNALLCELREDIFHSFQESLSVENLYKYFHELKSVAKNNIKVKSYFWKDGALFKLCGELLQKFGKHASVSVDERADEIECMVLVAETLSEMLRQTEALTACHMALQKCSTAFYTGLICALIEAPTLPNTLKYDSELNSLSQDYTAAACDVFFELITISEQISWLCSDLSHTTFTNHILFSVMDSQAALVPFLEKIMSSLVEMWTNVQKQPHMTSSPRSLNSSDSNLASLEPLTPGQVVKLFRDFTVLHRCLTKCKQIQERAEKMFKEEFKYYIRPEALQSKVPSTYPLSGVTRNVVSAVACHVLNKGQCSEQ